MKLYFKIFYDPKTAVSWVNNNNLVDNILSISDNQASLYSSRIIGIWYKSYEEVK